MLVAMFLLGCNSSAEATDDSAKSGETKSTETLDAKSDSKATAKTTQDKKETKKIDAKQNKKPELETITLGAGCFWCIEAVLDRIEGIEEVTSG